MFDEIVELVNEIGNQPSCFPIDANVNIIETDTAISMEYAGRIITKRSGDNDKEQRRKQFIIDLLIAGINRQNVMFIKYIEKRKPKPAPDMDEGFAAWFARNYTEVHSKELKKSAWVKKSENWILTHGSDWFYTELIKNHGITVREAYIKYLNR